MGPVGGTQTQRSAACLKAVSLGFGKEGTGGGDPQRGQPGGVGKAPPGTEQGRCRQPGAGRGRGLQPLPLEPGVRAAAGSGHGFRGSPESWSFPALPAHGAGTLHPAEPTDPALTGANPFPQPGYGLCSLHSTPSSPSQLQAC